MKPRVLVVEDERAIQIALSGLLTREGYVVETAGTGEAAIAALTGATDPFDCVLTDLSLGEGLTGMDVLKKERSFNEAAGFNASHDRLPEFMKYEPLPLHNAVFGVSDEELDSVYGSM